MSRLIHLFSASLFSVFVFSFAFTATAIADDDGERQRPIALGQSGFGEPTPLPYDLSAGPYSFTYWSPNAPAGTYPAHMIFEQTQTGDPGLTVEMGGYWTLPYNLISRSRINGLGDDGIAFINTSNAQDHPDAGYLGSAILALNTLGQEHIEVIWTGGTVTPNSRIYALRLQYRAGDAGPFQDLLCEDNQPVEYVRDEVAGHREMIGPVRLPAWLEDLPYVQLRWKYYYVSGDSGARAQLRIENIIITSGQPGGAVGLVFDTQPNPAKQAFRPLDPVIVRAVDANGVTASGFNGPVSLRLAGNGVLNGNVTVNAVNGISTFEGLSIEGVGDNSKIAEADGLASAQTAEFQVVRVTELVMPRFIQGDQDVNNENNDRIPFVSRLQIEGLTPGATYRYGNRIVISEDPRDQNGAGNSILITGLETDWVRNTNAPRFLPSDYGILHLTFTTDSEGSHTGWFVTEPSGNARFTPGNTVFVRLLLNDGQGGEEYHHYLTTESPVEVVRFGSTMTDATAVYGEAVAGSRNFVLLYDDGAGESRPLSSTPIEGTGAEVDARYAGFYVGQVAGRDGLWGTLMPNANPSGIRRVEERSLLTGEIMAVNIFPGGLSGTVDPSGGGAPVFADLDGGPVFLPQGSASWNVPFNWSTGQVPNAADAQAIVHLTTDNNREISLNVPVTVGLLTLNNDTSSRNRINGGTGGSLSFNSTAGEATLRVGGHGTGLHEFEIDNGIFLQSALRATVNNVDAEGEYGALRIRGTVAGPGGLTKDGFGVLSLTGDNKNYTGPTVIESGVLRVTESSQPRFTSEVRVNPSGQLRLVSHGENRVYDFGGDLVLDSHGPTDGPVSLPQAGRLGALRLDPELELRNSTENRHTASVSNDIMFAGESHIHIDGTSNRLTLSGALSGEGILIKSGGGDLVLTGNNLFFEGGTLLHRGALRVESGSFLGSGLLEFEASGGAQVELLLDNADQIVSGLEGSVEEGSSATIVLGGGHTLVIDQAGDTRYQGSIGGPGSLVKRGDGVLRLTRGPNLFGGSLTVERGAIEVTGPSHPSEGSGVVVGDGGQLRLASGGHRIYTFGPGAIILGGVGLDPAQSAAKGALRQEPGTELDVVTVTNAIELSGAASIHVNNDGGEGSALILTGNISGAADLRKTGGGRLELHGSNVDLNGGTVIENGVLRVAPGSRLGAGPLTFVDPDRPRTLIFENNAQTAAGLSGTVEEGGSLELRLGAGHTLTVDQGGDSFFGGSITGEGNFVKSGVGLLVLEGANTFGGTIAVEGGVLRIDGSATDAAGVSVAAGARLEGTGQVSALSGGGTVVPGSDSPGVMTAASFDSAGGLGAAFVFARKALPGESAEATGGDILRLTDPESPFVSPLGGSNRVDLFFDVGELSAGDVFRGGVAAVAEGALGASVADADFRFYVRDDEGDTLHRGVGYRLYESSLFPKIEVVGEPGGGEVLQVAWIVESGYQSWRDLHFPDPGDRENDEVSGPWADPFGTGVANLMNYALDCDPREVGREGLPEIGLDGGRLAILFRRDSGKSDIAYVVQASSDLVDWIETLYDSLVDLQENTDGEKMKIVDTQEVSVSERRFLRLRVVELE